IKIRVRETRVRQGVLLVNSDCLVKSLDSLDKAVEGKLPTQIPALKIKLQRFGICRVTLGHLGFYGSRKPGFEMARNVARHIALELDEVRKLTFVSVAPNNIFRLGVDQFDI